jgi:hypothetical protein
MLAGAGAFAKPGSSSIAEGNIAAYDRRADLG